jgi:hypothetical protein
MYVCVCMHRKVLVAWPGSWPWRPSHINNNSGKVLHDNFACPNMASATWLHTWIINYYWSHGAIRTHHLGQFRFTKVKLKYPHVKSWLLPNIVFDYGRVPNNLLWTLYKLKNPLLVKLRSAVTQQRSVNGRLIRQCSSPVILFCWVANPNFWKPKSALI